MLISIIIPVYNQEKYLNNCIKSAIEQKYKNIEIILINDGSEDNSLNIIKKWSRKDHRIKYISQQNKGVSAARNKGITIASGQYIFFLDADDYLEKSAILKLMNNAKKTKADIIIGNFYERTNGEIVKKNSFENMLFNKLDLHSIQTQLEMFIVNNRHMAKAGNKLYRLDFIKDYQIIFMDGVVAEDRLFNLMCYVNSPVIQVINEYTYIYNILEDSRSRTLSNNFYEENISLLHNFYKYLQKESKLEQNLELFQLNVIYDVQKVINQTYEHANNRYNLTSSYINRLRNDPLIVDTILTIVKQRKFRITDVGKEFNRMKLINYLLVKAPYLILFYKTIGYFTRSIRYR